MKTIKVTEITSDWFHDVDKEIDETEYTHFKLRGENLVWMLDFYRAESKVDHAQIVYPLQIIEDLNVTEIIGNRYRTVKELFRK